MSWKRLADDLDRVDLRERRAVVLVVELAQPAAELLLFLLRVRDAEVGEPARQVVDVLARGVDEEPRQLADVVVAELSDLAEVDEADAVAGQDEDVRRVRVAVEEPVPEDHRHPRLAHPVREAAPLLERVRQRVDVRDLRPLEELERQHARARVAPVDVRDLDVRVAGPVAAEAVGVAAFRAVVELRADRARELVDERARVDEVERADPLLRDARRLVEEREVGLDLPRRARPLHLHRDALAVRQRRAVHLPDRRGRDRRRIEVEERALEREAELRLDDLLDLLERERPDVVLQRRAARR